MNKLKRFHKDNRGAILAWIIALVLIFSYSVIWFTAGWAAMKVADTVEAEFTLDAKATGTINLLREVFAYHPVIVIIGYLLYAFAYSQRRDVRFDTI